jgi:hypothetical protein
MSSLICATNARQARVRMARSLILIATIAIALIARAGSEAKACFSEGASELDLKNVRETVEVRCANHSFSPALRLVLNANPAQDAMLAIKKGNPRVKFNIWWGACNQLDVIDDGALVCPAGQKKDLTRHQEFISVYALGFPPKYSEHDWCYRATKLLGQTYAREFNAVIVSLAPKSQTGYCAAD